MGKDTETKLSNLGFTKVRKEGSSTVYKHADMAGEFYVELPHGRWVHKVPGSEFAPDEGDTVHALSVHLAAQKA